MTLHELMNADDVTFLKVSIELSWFGQLVLEGTMTVTDEYWGLMAALKDEYERRWPNPGEDGKGFEALETTLELVERFSGD